MWRFIRISVVLTLSMYCTGEMKDLTAVPGKPAVPVSNPTEHPNWRLFEHDRCGQSESDRIIGGQDASLGAYPWIVQVGYLGPHSKRPVFRCGAVLVSKNYIVTAAHCVSKLPQDLYVGVLRLGEHNTETNPDCEDEVCADPIADYVPSEVIVHAEYGNPQFKNDIALIRTEKEVVFGYYVMPICMIHGDLLSKNYVGSTSEVAGWGIYDIEQPMPAQILQTIKLSVLENKRCEDAFVAYAQIGPTQMCVGGLVGKDSCGGDSGGPLMKVDSYDKGPRYYLLGVVSFGAKRCGATTMPGVYSRISDFLDWILVNMHD